MTGNTPAPAVTAERKVRLSTTGCLLMLVSHRPAHCPARQVATAGRPNHCLCTLPKMAMSLRTHRSPPRRTALVCRPTVRSAGEFQMTDRPCAQAARRPSSAPGAHVPAGSVDPVRRRATGPTRGLSARMRPGSITATWMDAAGPSQGGLYDPATAQSCPVGATMPPPTRRRVVRRGLRRTPPERRRDRRPGREGDERERASQEGDPTSSQALDRNMAERVGFEPTLRHNRKPDFESGAFDHSATSPDDGAARPRRRCGRRMIRARPDRRQARRHAACARLPAPA